MKQMPGVFPGRGMLAVGIDSHITGMHSTVSCISIKLYQLLTQSFTLLIQLYRDCVAILVNKNFHFYFPNKS